jgi:hypothetical protein
MQEPLKYATDCIHFIGYVIDHAPWSPIEEDKMRTNSDEGSDRWRLEFQSDISTDHLYNTIDVSCDYTLD